jgi:hypothetical protein
LRDGDSPRRSAVKKKLCADHRGFSLHVALRVGAGKRNRLERGAVHSPPSDCREAPVGDTHWDGAVRIQVARVSIGNWR